MCVHRWLLHLLCQLYWQTYFFHVFRFTCMCAVEVISCVLAPRAALRRSWWCVCMYVCMCFMSLNLLSTTPQRKYVYFFFFMQWNHDYHEDHKKNKPTTLKAAMKSEKKARIARDEFTTKSTHKKREAF